ncbi:MAG: hypothetical protein M3512_10665 [Bacteroidota bacterium]|nr:hypothetical protein [Bacteroidota bacterium]
MIDYANNQEANHLNTSFREEYVLLLEEHNIQFEKNICYKALFNYSMVVAVIFYIARYHGLFGFKPAGLGVQVIDRRTQVYKILYRTQDPGLLLFMVIIE